MEIIDLHCDLLAYLALNPNRTLDDSVARCSRPQLKEGGVKIQTLAIYTATNIFSLLYGLKQLEIFESIASEQFLCAYENASGFATEEESLEAVFTRLEGILERVTPLYISLTWNHENRFGGGCGSASGLKEDGKELLQFLSGRNIAIDFSHATDRLAREILEFSDNKKLDLPVMASHSNFRPVVDNIRNLPDDIAQEIIRRKGIIGLVLYSKFLKSPEKLYDMIEHGLKLGGQRALSFGADFFCLEDVSELIDPGGNFFDEISDASKYPWVIEGIKKNMQLDDSQLEAIASKNAKSFIARNALSELYQS